jgi:hypothetical protein
MVLSLTIAMVMIDGLGIYTKPDRFGSPALAVRLNFALVTLKPVKALSPLLIS